MDHTVFVELLSQKYISIFVVSLLFVKYVFVSLLFVKYNFVFAFEGTTLSSLWIFFCNLSYSLDSYSLSSGGLGVPLLVHICSFFVFHLLSNHESNGCQCFSTKDREKKKICRQLALTVKSPALPCVFNSGRCSDGLTSKTLCSRSFLANNDA